LSSSLGPCVLEGRYVRLEPLKVEHVEALVEAAQDSDWSWMSVDGRIESATRQWVRDTLAAQERGTEYPFIVYRKATGGVVGSTRYMDVRVPQRGVEIGWTWYSARVWGTAVNPECKFLMMSHAFEDWGAIRVQLKTDNANLHSQKAILKLGARFEGRLRNHRVRQDGSHGDSMMYSVTVEEWQSSVKQSLHERVRAFGDDRPASPRMPE
jgi:N-acetyltransferase